MSADNKNFLNFVKIIAGLPGTHCSYDMQTTYIQCTSIAVHITVVTRFNVFTCLCQQVNHGSLSTTHAYAVTYPIDCVSLRSVVRRPKTIFRQMLATTEQKPNLEQSTSELGKYLTVLSDTRIRWHCHQTNVCGCQRSTDSYRINDYLPLTIINN